jgi:hypothetical protein
MSKGISKEPSLERAAFRSKGLKEGEDDVRVFFKDPYNVRGKDRLLCFVSEHTVNEKHLQVLLMRIADACPCCSDIPLL